ncbi:hypothetical protein [Halocatena halophila]|uniref:hypothetical protein n=1 Tax=Halocatena halophila TaxID=2814576 RepID=UPI002ED6957D
MVTIGGTALPGIKTEVESANSTSVNIGAPAQIGLIGQADLANGTANTDEVYEIRTPVAARNLFGRDSSLTKNATNALSEGAYPVYCVAASETTVTAETVDAQTGNFTETPVIEDGSEISVTLDSSVTAVKTLDNIDSLTAQSDEMLYNPVTGNWKLSQAPSTAGTVDYTAYDYPGAVDVMMADRSERIDFLGILNENQAAVEYAHQAVLQEVERYNFIIVLAGTSTKIANTADYANSFDSSRIQLIYPSRNADGMNFVGSVLGLRGELGIDNSPMFKRLNTENDLAVTLSKGEQTDLYNEDVVPIADEARGARIVEDVTCVANDNQAESAMSQSLHRLIVDYVTGIVHQASEPFIGELHTQSARNALRAVITSELERLRTTHAITAFTISVEKVDAMTARVNVGINTIDPLRNIIANISAGEIEGQSTGETEA